MKFDSLQHLQLSFSHQDYMEFFAVNYPTYESGPYSKDPTQRCGPAFCLRGLPSLKQLDIHFAAIHGGHVIEEDDCIGDSIREFHAVVLMSSCQKVLLDWILSFAKQYIEHIPKVTLTGYIKHSTKSKWDRILQDERNGVHHEIDLKALAVQARQILGSTCDCKNLCFATERKGYTKRVLDENWFSDRALRHYDMEALRHWVEEHFDFED